MTAAGFRTTMPRMKRSAVVLVVVLVLSGCLDVATEVELNDDGSGRIDLVYTVDQNLYELGVFDSSDVALPVPISEAEFRETARLVDGLDLRRYRMNAEERVVTVEVRMDFASVEVLSDWFGPGEDETSPAVSVTSAGGQTTWRQLLIPGGGSDHDLAAALGTSLDGYSLVFRISPPRDIVSSTPGTVSDGRRRAEVRVFLSEVATATEPVYWEVRW